MSASQTVIEPSESSLEIYALCATATVLDSHKQEFSEIRELKPSNSTVKTAKQTTVGTADPLDNECQVRLELKNFQELHNNHCVREIGLSPGNSKNTGVVKNLGISQGKTDSDESGTYTELSGGIPKEDRESFEKTLEERRSQKQNAVCCQFTRLLGCFLQGPLRPWIHSSDGTIDQNRRCFASEVHFWACSTGTHEN